MYASKTALEIKKLEEELNMTLQANAMNNWSVVATSAEVPVGGIVQAFLHGQELALWRNTAGTIQVWANRCPHRGTRFTMGRIVNDQLSCGYHGWRFDRNGLCTYIPAHPRLSPPKTLCAKTYQAVEHDGMIWACLAESDAGSPQLPSLAALGQHALFCRSFVVYQSADKVMHGLQQMEGHTYTSPQACVLVGKGPTGGIVTLLLQPMSEKRSTVYLWASSANAVDTDGAIRQAHNALFKRQRRQLEAVT